MPIFNVHDAKTNLSRLLAQVEAGEDVVIARRGQPVARLVRHTLLLDTHAFVWWIPDSRVRGQPNVVTKGGRLRGPITAPSTRFRSAAGAGPAWPPPAG